MTDPSLIESLQAAVAARPDDLPLRVHLAQLLLAAGRQADAVTQAAQVLAHDPQNEAARRLMSAAITGADPAPAATEVDWSAMEDELAEVVPPRFVRSGDTPEPVAGMADRTFDVETSSVRLADVGGMDDVKRRLELAFLGPLRNPQLRTLFGKSLRGGLLLYGPPGCGKTFLARAVAGEMGARFISLSIVDVLDMWIGRSERNLHDVFEAARRNAPCVLFLDEVDALGHKRSQLNSSAMRTLGNQLLAELDGVDGDNEGVFVLAATNAPWDVDAALRRPGRLDRMLLVLPPDAPARAAILTYHLRDRPVAGVDLDRLVAATEHFSGADLAHLCESAAELAIHDAVVTGEVRMIEQADFDTALRDIRPSTGTARVKSDAGERVVPLGPQTVDALRAYQARRARWRERCGEAWPDTGLFFVQRDGAAWHPQTVSIRFRRLVADSGLPPVRLHDLRHGAATYLRHGGADLKEVQATLGHASIAFTADTYTSVIVELHRASTETAERLIPRNPPPG